MAGRAILRDVKCQIGELGRADGCARYSHGETEVLCSLAGPLVAPERRSDTEQAVIEVVVRGRDETTRAGGASRVTMDCEKYDEALGSSELAAVVRSCMEAVVDLSVLPRQRLLLTLHVLSDAGSLSSVAVNAAMLAVLDSGLPCVATLAAAEACTVNQKLILDPSAADLAQCDSTAFFAHLVGEEGGMVASRTSGTAMNNDLYWLFHKTTKNAAATLSNLFRRFLSEQKGATTKEAEEAV